ncbi:Thioesterase/thiol ester dehydrase-isomerase [Thozetella sp. PMI_491]|nr:Thioesterase/thiol ester dehydrase-isomerase [Thozetella sp. PMI_491]
MGAPCFHAVCSFKLPEPHSHGVTEQEESVQKRFADILASRKPQDWPPAPPVDVDAIVRLVGADMVGTFPIVDMKKVDMTEYNRGRPLPDRRELLLYRLLAPLPADGTDGWDANAHVLVHAYEADRNGLLMMGNHVGFGDKFGRAASLSYSFVVHTGAEEAVMRFEEQDDHGGGWWVQEASFPRVSNGRGTIVSKIWSPRGLHVATEYQDGLCKGWAEKIKL